jgi:hypothetical protein
MVCGTAAAVCCCLRDYVAAAAAAAAVAPPPSTVPLSYDILLENFLDPAHVPHSHHGVVVSGNHPALVCGGVGWGGGWGSGVGVGGMGRVGVGAAGSSCQAEAVSSSSSSSAGQSTALFITCCISCAFSAGLQGPPDTAHTPCSMPLLTSTPLCDYTYCCLCPSPKRGGDRGARTAWCVCSVTGPPSSSGMCRMLPVARLTGASCRQG